ncbi:7-dehydrocholesterol reductase [Thalictrum thalictroides]|uniref:7-dehydrocholesterol reductase n=1 Tax=Thalictrum thalictroides TaxID=46969 RepID=A0A7J6WKR5_THATH|nr:7-dehydrocholesterol reductase [Thalictrum thalictroides]
MHRAAAPPQPQPPVRAENVPGAAGPDGDPECCSSWKETIMAETPKMVHAPIVTYVSVLSLLTLCPPFVILLWYTMVHADGSVVQTWNYLNQQGLQGFKDLWPIPTAIAWKIIAAFAAFEALLQLFLPGKRVEGPISPMGNQPVYKANGVLAYAVTLVTYISLWW